MENWYGETVVEHIWDEETKLGLVLNMFTFEIFIKHLRGDVKWVTPSRIQDAVHHVKDISRWESGVKEWAKTKEKNKYWTLEHTQLPNPSVFYGGGDKVIPLATESWPQNGRQERYIHTPHILKAQIIRILCILFFKKVNELFKSKPYRIMSHDQYKTNPNLSFVFTAVIVLL